MNLAQIEDAIDTLSLDDKLELVDYLCTLIPKDVLIRTLRESGAIS